MSSLLAMPLVVFNLGGEMLYILNQRLHAQKIPPEKSTRVLEDVVRVMFDEKFIAELFKRQPVYPQSSTREIFYKVAHSSIMRLSESSMEKLYDLMLMGIKYQALACVHPREMLEVTLSHLETILDLVASNASVHRVVESVRQRVIDKYADLSQGQFFTIRQALLNFLQDKRVKVSLFLQDHVQNSDGSFVVTRGGMVPPNGSIPGKIRMLHSEARTSEVSFSYPITGSIPYPRGADPLDRNSRVSDLGQNMYRGDRSASKRSFNNLGDIRGSRDTTGRPVDLEPEHRTRGSEELNFLARLIKDPDSSSQLSKDIFKINLFWDEDVEDGPSQEGGSSSSAVGGASSGSPNSKTVEQIGSTDVKSRAALRGIMSEFDHLEEERQSGRGGGVSSASARRGSGGGEDEEDEEDLMDLLDA